MNSVRLYQTVRVTSTLELSALETQAVHRLRHVPSGAPLGSAAIAIRRALLPRSPSVEKKKMYR